VAPGLDAMSVYAGFIHPTSSIAPMLLLFVPLYNLVILTPLGIAAGRLQHRRDLRLPEADANLIQFQKRRTHHMS
jgi:hypothetical protein